MGAIKSGRSVKITFGERTGLLICERYVNGEASMTLATVFGIDSSTVLGILRHNNV